MLDRNLVKNRYHCTSTESYDLVYFTIGPQLMGSDCEFYFLDSLDNLAMWFYMRKCNLQKWWLIT